MDLKHFAPEITADILPFSIIIFQISETSPDVLGYPGHLVLVFEIRTTRATVQAAKRAKYAVVGANRTGVLFLSIVFCISPRFVGAHSGSAF